MTKEIDHLKFNIIQEVMKIEDKSILKQIAQNIKFSQPEVHLWAKVMQTTRKSISLEEMKKEQNYAPIHRDEFFKLTADLGIEESLDKLLSQLD